MTVSRAAAALAVSVCINGNVADAFVPTPTPGNAHGSAHRNTHSVRLASSMQPPIVPHLPSSDGDSKEVMNGPFDHLFWSQQHREQGTVSNAYIVLFDRGLRSEGVHTIEFPKQSGSHLILAFDSFRDCQQFAECLGIQSDSMPVPQKISKCSLKAYAANLGMTIQAVPAGMSLKPSQNQGFMTSSGYKEDQVLMLLKLKEQKACLEQLIGSSHCSSSSGSVEELAWG
jgi:hypothetical protein